MNEWMGQFTVPFNYDQVGQFAENEEYELQEVSIISQLCNKKDHFIPSGHVDDKSLWNCIDEEHNWTELEVSETLI